MARPALDFRDLRSAAEILSGCPAIKRSTLYWWIGHAEEMGLAPAIVRIGRKLLIHEPTFNAWLARHSGRKAA